MGRNMTWVEMKRTFPNEWLLITEFELNEYGQIISGVVERHSREKDKAANPAIIDRDTAFRYTGESTFSGLRSHAEHNHAF